MGYQLTGEQQSTSDKIEMGVYSSTVKVLEIEDFSNYPGQAEEKSFPSGFKPELCLKVKVDTGQREKNIILFGKFKKDKVTNKVVGWDHFNNDVERFLLKAAGTMLEINDDFTIPSRILQLLKGSEIIVLRYVSGTYTDTDGQEKPSSNDWSKVFDRFAKPDQISLEWSKNKQYVKNFHPEVQEAWEKRKDKGNAEFATDSAVTSEEPLF